MDNKQPQLGLQTGQAERERKTYKTWRTKQCRKSSAWREGRKRGREGGREREREREGGRDTQDISRQTRSGIYRGLNNKLALDTA